MTVTQGKRPEPTTARRPGRVSSVVVTLGQGEPTHRSDDADEAPIR